MVSTVRILKIYHQKYDTLKKYTEKKYLQKTHLIKNYYPKHMNF